MNAREQVWRVGRLREYDREALLEELPPRSEWHHGAEDDADTSTITARPWRPVSQRSRPCCIVFSAMTPSRSSRA